MAQVWFDPAEIEVIVFPVSTPVEVTATGTFEFVLEPFPN